MARSNHPIRNIVLPAVILVPLIGIMVGCLYIPTFDHTILDGTKKDFRGWAGDHEHWHPQELAAMTRSYIEATFGKPVYLSADKQSVAYVMGSESGIWVWPLCFGAEFDNGAVHVLKLNYDLSDRLNSLKLLSGHREVPAYLLGSDMTSDTRYEDPKFAAIDFIREENQHCPSKERLKVPDGNESPTTTP